MNRDELKRELEEARTAARTDPDLHLVREMYDGAGERERQRLGIDGTPSDAQDRAHPAFTPDSVPFCLACGLAATAAVHQ